MAMAATAVTVLGAQDATCLEPLVSFLFLFLFLFFITLIFIFKSTQHVETTMAATAAAARDVTRLKSCLIFYFRFLYYMPVKSFCTH